MIGKWMERRKSVIEVRDRRKEVEQVCKDLNHDSMQISLYLSERLKEDWSLQDVCDWMCDIPSPQTYCEVKSILGEAIAIVTPTGKTK